MSVPPGERDLTPGPELEVSPASIGFALAFEAGRALLRLADRTLVPGALLRTADFQIPDVRFPLDVSGGADRFQGRRLALHALHLELDLLTLAPLLARRLQASAVTLSRWQTEQGILAIEGHVGDATTGGFVAHVALGAVRGLRLRAQVFDVACLGAAALTPTLVAEALLAAVPGVGEAEATVGAREIDLGEVLLQPLLIGYGWKRAATDGVEVDAITVADGRVHVVACSDAPPAWLAHLPRAPVSAALQRGARAMAHADQLLPVQQRLVQGQVAEAMREARKLVDRALEDDAVVAAAVEALTLDPGGVDEALELFASARARGDLAVLATSLRLGRGAEAQLEILTELAQAAQGLGLTLLSRRAHDACGWAALQVDRTLEALEAFERALTVGGDDERALRGAFESCRALGRLDDAVRFGERALRAALEPDRALAVAVGELHLVLGDGERARRAFRRALREGPRADALLGLARVAAEAQDPVRAVSLLGAAAAAATEADDRSALRLALTARARFQLEALDDAAGAFRSAMAAMEAGALEPALLLVAARAADHLRDALTARELYERLLPLADRPALRALASYRLGMLLLDAGEMVQAEQHLATAVRLADALSADEVDGLDPDLAGRAREALLRLRAEGGDLVARAELHLLEASRLPDAAARGAAMLEASRCFVALGQRGVALERFLDAIELHPPLAGGLPELRALLEGVDSDGLRYAARRLEILSGGPAWPPIALALARGLRARGALNDAAAILERAVDDTHPLPELLVERGELGRVRGDLERLDDSLRRIAEVDHGDGGLQALVERARLLAGPRGVPSLAIEVYASALERGGEPGLRLELAEAQLALGDQAAAQATLELALRVGPDPVRWSAARALVALHRARGEPDAALAAARLAEGSAAAADIEAVDALLEELGRIDELVARLAARGEAEGLGRAVHLAATRLGQLDLALDCAAQLGRVDAGRAVQTVQGLLDDSAGRAAREREQLLAGVLRHDLLPARRVELQRQYADLLRTELDEPARAAALYRELFEAGERDRDLLVALRELSQTEDPPTALRVAGELSDRDLEASALDAAHLGDHRTAAELARQLGNDLLERRFLERLVDAAQGMDVVVEPPLLPSVLRLADLYAAAGQPEDQSRTLARAVLHCRDDATRAGLFRRIAELEERTLARPDLAAQALERVLRLFPGDEEAVAALSRLYEFLGQLEPLVALHQDLAARAPLPAQRAAALIAAGDALALSGEVHRANRFYHLALSAAPESRAALGHIAQLARRQGSHAMLVRGYLHAARHRDGGDTAHLLEEAGAMLAGLLLRPRLAARVLRRAVRIEPASVSAALALVEVARACPDPDQGVATLAWLHGLAGLAPAARVEATLAYAEALRLSEGESEEVWELYRQALALDGNNLRALDAMLVHSARSGELALYQELLARRLAHPGGHPTALHLEAAGILQQVDPGAARGHLEAAIGDARLEGSGLDTAIALARRLEAPTLLAQGLSRALQRPSEVDARIEHLRELGRVLDEQLADLAGAIEAWQALLELSPQDLRVRIRLGERLLGLGRAPQACTQLDLTLQALESAPRSELWSRAARLRTRVAEQQGDDALVIALLRGLCELHPAEQGLRIRLAAALERQGQVDEAARWLDQALDLAGEPADRAYLQLRHARVLEVAGEHARAARSYLAVVDLDPVVMDAWRGAQRCAEASADPALQLEVDARIEVASVLPEGAAGRCLRLLHGALAAGDAAGVEHWLARLGPDDAVLRTLRANLDRIAEMGLGDVVERVVDAWPVDEAPAARVLALRRRAALRQAAGAHRAALDDLRAAWLRAGDDAELREDLLRALQQVGDVQCEREVLREGAWRSAQPDQAVDLLRRWHALEETPTVVTEAALEVWQRWTELDPDDPVPRLALAAAWHRARNWEALLQVVAPLDLDALEAKARAELAWQRGEAAWHLGDVAGASADLAVAWRLQPAPRALDPELERVALRAFLASADAGADPERQLGALQRAVELEPGAAAGWWALIDALQTQGQDARAAEVALRAAEVLGEASALPLLVRWFELAGANLGPDAATPLRRWIALDPTAERPRQALVSLLDAGTAGDELLELLRGLAEQASDREARRQALHRLGEVAALHGRAEDQCQAAQRLADMACEDEDYDAEVALLHQLLNLSSPEVQPDLRRRLADRARAAGDRAGLRASLQWLANAAQAHDRELEELAGLAQDDGDIEAAASLLVQAAHLAREPSRASVLFARWSELGAPLSIEQELDVLTDWCRTDPGALRPALRSALLLSATSRWAEAVNRLLPVEEIALTSTEADAFDAVLAEAAAQCEDLPAELSARRRMAKREPTPERLERFAAALERAHEPAAAAQVLGQRLAAARSDQERAALLERQAALRAKAGDLEAALDATIEAAGLVANARALLERAQDLVERLDDPAQQDRLDQAAEQLAPDWGTASARRARLLQRALEAGDLVAAGRWSARLVASGADTDTLVELVRLAGAREASDIEEQLLAAIIAGPERDAATRHDALLRRAGLHEAQADFGAAIADLEHVRRGGGLDASAQDHLVELLCAAGRGDEARQLLLERAAQTDDPAEQARFYAGWWNLGDQDGAAAPRAVLEAWAQAAPGVELPLRLLASQDLDAGRLDDARHRLRQLGALAPDATARSALLEQLLDLAWQLGDVTDVVELAASIEALGPLSPEARERQIACLVDLEHYADAAELLERRAATSADPEQRQADQRRAAELWRDGAEQPERALSLFLNLYRDQPLDRSLMAASAELLEQCGRHVEQARLLREAAERASGLERRELLRRAAELHAHELGEVALAVDLVDLLVHENPNDAGLRAWRRRLLEELGEPHRLASALVQDLGQPLAEDRGAIQERLVALAGEGFVTARTAVDALASSGGFEESGRVDLATLADLATEARRFDLVEALAGRAAEHGDRALAADLLERCTDAARAAGDGERAVAQALRVLQLDPARTHLLGPVVRALQDAGRDEELAALWQASQPHLDAGQAQRARVELAALAARRGGARDALVDALEAAAPFCDPDDDRYAVAHAALAAGLPGRVGPVLRALLARAGRWPEDRRATDLLRALLLGPAVEGLADLVDDEEARGQLRAAGVVVEAWQGYAALGRAWVARTLAAPPSPGALERAVAICTDLLGEQDTALVVIARALETATTPQGRAAWHLRRARLAARAGIASSLADDLVAAVQACPGDRTLCDEARDLAAASGDGSLLARVLELRANAVDSAVEAWRLRLRAAQAARTGGDRVRTRERIRPLEAPPSGVDPALLDEAYALAQWAGAPAVARAALDSLLAMGDTRGEILLAAAALAARAGDADRAEALARLGCQGAPALAGAAGHLRWDLARSAGDRARELEALEALRARQPASHVVDAAWRQALEARARELAEDAARPGEAAELLIDRLAGDVPPAALVNLAERWARAAERADLISMALTVRARSEHGRARSATLLEAARELPPGSRERDRLVQASLRADPRNLDAHRGLARDETVGASTRLQHALAAWALAGDEGDLELAHALSRGTRAAATQRDLGVAMACRGLRAAPPPDVEQVLAAAAWLEAEGRWAEASGRQLQVALRDPAAGHRRLQALTEQGRVDERDRLLARWAARRAAAPPGALLLWQARLVAEREGDVARALELLDRALQDSPNLELPEVLQRARLAAGGDVREQVRFLEIQARPGARDDLRRVALRRLAALADPAAAQRARFALLELEPDNLELAAELVEALLGAGQGQVAAAQAARALDAARRCGTAQGSTLRRLLRAIDAVHPAPRDRRDRALIGALQLGAGDAIEVGTAPPEACLVLALREREGRLAAAAWEAWGQAVPGDTGRAVAAAELAHLADPSPARRDRLEASCAEGQLYERLAAAYEYQVTTLQDPARRASLHFNLAGLYLDHLRRSVRARRHLRAAAALSPEDAIILRARVEVERQHGTPAALADSLEDLAATTTPAQAAALLVEAGLALVDVDPERATALLEQSVQTTPRQFEAQVALGHLYERAASLDAAVVCYEVAADLAGESLHTQQLWLKIGRLAEHGLEDQGLALRAYLAAADAGNALALASAERLARARGSRETLEQVLGRRAVATQNGEVRRDLLLERAALLSALGRLREARLVVDGLAQERPQDPVVLLNGGALLEGWRLLAPATALYEQALALPAAALDKDARAALEQQTMALLAVQGNWPRAVELARAVIARTPDSEPALAVLEAAARELHDDALLLQVLPVRVQQTAQPAPRVALRCDLAGVLERSGRSDEAVAVLEQAVAEEDASALASRSLFDLLGRRGELAAQAVVAERLGAHAGEDAAAGTWLRVRVAAARQAGDRELAIRLLQQLVRREPEDVGSYDALWELQGGGLDRSAFASVARMGRDRVVDPAARARLATIEAELRLEADDDERALEAIRAGLAEQPDAPGLLELLRRVAQRRGHPEWLAPALEAAIAAADDDAARVEWLRELAQLLDATLVDEGQATATLRRLLALRPDDAQARVRLGELRFRAQAYAEARDLLRGAPEPDEASAAAGRCMMLAECARHLGELDAYEHMLVEALQRDPGYAPALEALALHLAATDRLEQGLQRIQEARAQGFELSRAVDLHWRKLEAEHLARRGEPEQAAERLWEALALEPRDAELLRALVRHLTALAPGAALAEALRRLAPLERTPAEQVERYCEAGEVLLEVGDATAAARAFAQACDVDAHSPRVLAGQAQAALAAHDGRRFVEAARRLLEVEPDHRGSAAFHAALADALRAEDEPGAAVLQQLLRALEQAPADREVQLTALEVAAQAGDAACQVQLLERLLETAEDADEIHQRAAAAARLARDALGDRRRAIGLMYRAHAANPGALDVKRELARLYIEDPATQREARTALAQLVVDDVTDASMLHDIAHLDRGRNEPLVAELLDELARLVAGEAREGPVAVRFAVQQPVALDQLLLRDWPRAEHQLLRIAGAIASAARAASRRIPPIFSPLRDPAPVQAHLEAVDRFVVGPELQLATHLGEGLEVDLGRRQVALSQDLLNAGEVELRAALTEAAVRVRWGVQLARLTTGPQLETLAAVALDALGVEHQLQARPELASRLAAAATRAASPGLREAATRAAAALPAPLDRRHLGIWLEMARQLLARAVICATGSVLPGLALLAGTPLASLVTLETEARHDLLRRRESRLLVQFATSDVLVLLAKAAPSR